MTEVNVTIKACLDDEITAREVMKILSRPQKSMTTT